MADRCVIVFVRFPCFLYDIGPLRNHETLKIPLQEGLTVFSRSPKYHDSEFGLTGEMCKFFYLGCTGLILTKIGLILKIVAFSRGGSSVRFCLYDFQ